MRITVVAALLAISAGAALAGSLNVQVRNGKVRATPSQLGKVVADVAYGAKVEAGTLQNGWYPVTLPDGKTGWLHESALTKKRIVMSAGTGDAATGAADWLLRQVGLQPGMSPEEWAASRNLHTYQQDFSPGGRYYGGGQAQAKPVAVTGGVARDQGDQAPDWQRGSGPGPTDINVAAGEYDNLPYYGGLPSQGGGQRGGEGVSQGGGSRASRDSGPAAGATSKPSLYGNLPDTTPDPTGPLPYYDTPKTEAAPQAQKFVRSRYFGN